MEEKKYIAVDTDNIKLLTYEYSVGINGNPKPHIIRHSYGTAKEIFDKNGVPEEFQKIFMVANPISMSIQKRNPSESNLYAFKYHRFRAYEFLTGLSIFLSFSKRGEIYGQQENYPCAFHVSKCYECSGEEMINFMGNLKHDRILESYVKSIAEMTQYRPSVSYELYEAQLKYYHNKIFGKKR